MNAAENITAKKLAELSVTEPDQVAPLVARVRARFDDESTRVHGEESWKLFRDAWLGRKSGVLTQVTDNWLKPAGTALKPAVGAALNQLRAHVEPKIEALHASIDSGRDAPVSPRDRVDFSLPGIIRPVGSRHLIRQVFQEIEDIFFSIGFSVAEGPEIETPYYNFEALNIPEFHPVRDDMDTFYLDLPKGAAQPLLLRTHTSPMQIRTMEKRQPPVRVIVPGKVYRRDNPDATHSFIFHQVEGLAVDHDLIFCGGSGSAAGGGTCSKCKGSGWIELFGAGMVDPAVYGFVKYDAKKVSGFAFGMGIDRLAMLKYGIDDIQVFFQNDVRFLRQFP